MLPPRSNRSAASKSAPGPGTSRGLRHHHQPGIYQGQRDEKLPRLPERPSSHPRLNAHDAPQRRINTPRNNGNFIARTCSALGDSLKGVHVIIGGGLTSKQHRSNPIRTLPTLARKRVNRIRCPRRTAILVRGKQTTFACTLGGLCEL